MAFALIGKGTADVNISQQVDESNN